MSEIVISRAVYRSYGKFKGLMAEAKYLVYFAHRMEFLSNEKYDELKDGYDKLGKKLWRFYETVRDKANP